MTEYLQTLTLQDVLEAGRKAYEAGHLTAQHPDPTLRLCVYQLSSDDKYHCVIGSALKPEVLAHRFCSGSVDFLQSFVKMSSEDLSRLSNLQKLHDEWCSAEDEGSREQARVDFVKAMGILD